MVEIICIINTDTIKGAYLKANGCACDGAPGRVTRAASPASFGGTQGKHRCPFYVEFALTNHREPVTQKLLSEAVTEFLVIKNHELKQDLISEPYLTRVKRDLKRLQKHFPDATVADVTGTKLIEYLEARKAVHKTFNNRRGGISAFLKFSMQREWIAENALVKISPRRLRRRRGCAVTFTAEQSKALMAFVEELRLELREREGLLSKARQKENILKTAPQRWRRDGSGFDKFIYSLVALNTRWKMSARAVTWMICGQGCRIWRARLLL